MAVRSAAQRASGLPPPARSGDDLARADAALWSDLKRQPTTSFGPALVTGPDAGPGRCTPWLLIGRPEDPARVGPACKPQRRSAKPAPPPAHAATQASRARDQRAKQAQARYDGTPQIHQPPAGPCPERHLPLSRHAPKNLSPAEQKLKQRWQPEREWRAISSRASDAGGATHCPLPFGALSPKVIAHFAAAEAADEEPRTLRVTSGGWAADASARTPAPSQESLDASLSSTWPLEEELGHWCTKAQAQRSKPRGTLALVDDFLNGPIAEAVLPVELHDW